MISRAVLRAHQLKSIGPGQRYLMEREWLPDGRVMQRINAGEAVLENDWREIGRWRDIDAERLALTKQGWVID